MELDPARLIADLNSQDELGLLLRGHLYIEGELVRFIQSHMPCPEKFDLSALNFPKKIYLAGALGILTDDEIEPYLVFNKLRNKLAHNLGQAVTDTDIRGLIESLNEKQLTLLTFAIESRPDRPHGLRECLLILFLYLFAHVRHQNGLAYDELAEWKRLYS